MKDFVKTKRLYIIALALLFVFVSLSETTYSFFIKSNTTSELNYNTGLLNLEFIEDEQITLKDAFPMIDSEGAKLKPYTLTLKNTGTIPYLYDLKMLADEGNIDSRYIKVKVNDNMPKTLASTSNTILSNNIIYPDEAITFKINVWIDNNTPNSELGKTFNAKIIASGESTYRTLDTSGANHPKLNTEMIPVYYDENSKLWRVTNENNNLTNHMWYNYSNKLWANSVSIKETDKYIYDITRKNDIKNNNVAVNNTNVIITKEYLDTGINNYNSEAVSNVFRIKFDKLANDNYIISNDKITYLYDSTSKRFIIRYGQNEIKSNQFMVDTGNWYIIGYTYDGTNIKFYANGTNIGSANAKINLNDSSTFKLGTDSTKKVISNITIGNFLMYNRSLSENEFSNNYKTSINVVKDGLMSGYNNFTPMTLREYYHNLDAGSEINTSDVKGFYVWIPRFKYMVWNGMGENNIDTYNAYGQGINISFEKDTAKTGLITCDNNECFGDINKTTKLTSSDNGKYYTHPAFSKTTAELTGFWVSKYEISMNNNLDIEAKDGNTAWRNSSLENYYKTVAKTNYHIIKNTEWGAISYLAHSKYGLCNQTKCKAASANETFISGNNIKDSTTNNMSGVFDMIGSASEYTMSAVNGEDISVSDVPISNDDYDLYKDISYILGDATKELTIESGIWDESTISNGTGNWIIRGGNSKGTMKGLFAYTRRDDIASEEISTRIIYK